jgi:hypothetical protein
MRTATSSHGRKKANQCLLKLMLPVAVPFLLWPLHRPQRSAKEVGTGGREGMAEDPCKWGPEPGVNISSFPMPHAGTPVSTLEIFAFARRKTYLIHTQGQFANGEGGETPVVKMELMLIRWQFVSH